MHYGSGWTRTLGGPPRVQREQKMLKRHLPRVIYHQVYSYTKIIIPNILRQSQALGGPPRVKEPAP